MPDAWEGSIDIAVAKARTAAFFSSDENALTTRVIGENSHPTSPKAGEPPVQPLWGIWASNQMGTSGGEDTRNGVITFPGGVPLYKDGKLVGGLGASGDGVEEDEAIALAGMAGFESPEGIAKMGLS